MNRFNTTAWMALMVTATCAGMAWGQAATQPAVATAPAADVGGVGTVNGDNVYVRSGFSTNYYPVIKLHKGDKVRILRGEHGWLEIEPPAGAFSLVEKTRVDKGAGEEGVANDTVQVYVGSDIDKRNYAKQVKLAKGEKVKIIGETEGGDFYKIAPPAGATVWISGDLVKRGDAGVAKIEKVKDLKAAQAEVGAKSGEAAKTASKSSKVELVAAKPEPKPAAPSVDPKELDANRVEMRALQAEIAAISAKAPTDRVFEPVMGRLQKLASQDKDFVGQAFAKATIEQIKDQMEVAAALGELQQLRQNAVSQADAIQLERAKIKAARDDWKINEIVARGEIRVSGLYTGEGGKAKRWRMVDPKTNRTIAYIELPPGSAIDPIQYYGKFVGVKATSYELLHGTVPPLPVYVISEIQVMDPSKPVEKIFRGEAAEAVASPVPPVAESPSTQPAAVKPTASQPAGAAPVAPNAN